jgi:ribosomal protein S18 acetylase RimI-like enzyme
MDLVRVQQPGTSLFKEAWKIYSSSFPSDEKRTFAAQKKILNNKQYSFFIVRNNNTLVAIIAQWDCKDFSFIEHIAVKKTMRGQGIGTALLQKIRLVKKKIVLEVERPHTHIAKERIRFYQKCGFQLNTFAYFQPPYDLHKKPVPLLLMTYPKKINKVEFILIRKELHCTVYGLPKPLLISHK